MNQLEQLRNTVCMYFNIRLEDLLSNRRNGSIPSARQMFCYLAHQFFPGHRYEEIAELVGLDRSSVNSAIYKINNLVDVNDPATIRALQVIDLLIQKTRSDESPESALMTYILSKLGSFEARIRTEKLQFSKAHLRDVHDMKKSISILMDLISESKK